MIVHASSAHNFSDRTEKTRQTSFTMRDTHATLLFGSGHCWKFQRIDDQVSSKHSNFQDLLIVLIAYIRECQAWDVKAKMNSHDHIQHDYANAVKMHMAIISRSIVILSARATLRVGRHSHAASLSAATATKVVRRQMYRNTAASMKRGAVPM